MKIVLDGVEAATGALRTTAARSSTNPLQIGGSLEGDVYDFRGALDDFRLWNTALATATSPRGATPRWPAPRPGWWST